MTKVRNRNGDVSSLEVGDVIDGKYDVVRLIAKGGMSFVWLASDQRLNKLWAIKELIRSSRGENNEQIIQTPAEADIMKRLDHPALPRIVDIIERERTFLIVMDYIPGEALDKTVKRVGHGLPEEDVISWGLQLCDVMSYLHNQHPPIIYRDMKPSNVMLRDDGSVVLIDLGIAREYKEGRTSDTRVMGTKGYAAPEQSADSAVQTDVRTDVYSLGVTLHHLVTGRAPQRDTLVRPIREINPALSEGLEHVISKATQLDMGKRYQSMAEMAYDLQNYETLTEGYRSGQKKKLHRFTSLCVAAGVCAVLGAGSIAASFMLKNSTYESYMQKAEAASVTPEEEDGVSEAEEYYLDAIETDATYIEPYDALVNSVYKYDSDFSLAEANRWAKIYSEYASSIQSDEAYAKLCYDVGILYYVYYAQGSESDLTSVGVSQAVTWFQRAIDSYDERTEAGRSCTLTEAERAAASVYVTIGEFYQKLEQNMLEGNEGEIYEGYWEALEEAYELVSDGSAATMVELRLYQIIYAAIDSNTYLSGFKSVGVSQSEAEDMLLAVLERTAALVDDASTSEKATQICDEILSGVDADDVAGSVGQSEAWSTIEQVYESVGGQYADAAAVSAETEGADA